MAVVCLWSPWTLRLQAKERAGAADSPQSAQSRLVQGGVPRVECAHRRWPGTVSVATAVRWCCSRLQFTKHAAAYDLPCHASTKVGQSLRHLQRPHIDAESHEPGKIVCTIRSIM